jgi:hypothetical protein
MPLRNGCIAEAHDGTPAQVAKGGIPMVVLELINRHAGGCCERKVVAFSWLHFDIEVSCMHMQGRG